MGQDGRGRTVPIITLVIFLLTIIFVVPVQSENPGNYICIGTCDSPIIPVPENQPPVLDFIGDQSVLEGSSLSFPVNVSDPENNISYIVAYIPLGSNLIPNGGNYTFNWIPDYSQAGIYTVNFTVTDTGGLSDYENIAITVTNVNLPPVIDEIESVTVPEGSLLVFIVNASDPDNNPLTFTAETPTGAEFIPFGKNYSFSWLPNYSQAGVYSVAFMVTDEGGLTDTETVVITVFEVNYPPVFDPIIPKTVSEGTSVHFQVHASDVDEDMLLYSVDPLPPGAYFNTSTQEFSWTPDYTQAGTYSINFTVIDAGGLKDLETVTIIVLDINLPPVLAFIGNRSIAENSNLTIIVNASDPDGGTLIYNATPLPLGATFDNSTQKFSFSPTYSQNGTYYVNFTVTDIGGLLDYENITITVSDVKVPPILFPIGNKTVEEGLLLNFTVNAHDPDSDLLTFNATPLPFRASFNASTKAFSWTPSYVQEGIYHINLTVTDADGLMDYENITITVSAPNPISIESVNYAPAFSSITDPIENQTVVTGTPSIIGYETYLITFQLQAIDFNSDNLDYGAVTLPQGATLNPVSGVFSWIPEYGAIGTYWISFTVTDGYITDVLSMRINVESQPMPASDCKK